MVIESWPESEAFRILGGEPALTLVPNLLVTGMLAIASSLLFLILLSIVMLLVGAGFGPPLVGFLLGVAATTRNHAPLEWRQTQLPPGSRRILAVLRPSCLGADLITWLLLLPSLVAIGSVFGADFVPPVLVFALIAAAFVFLLLAIVASFEHDIQRQIDTRRKASMDGEKFSRNALLAVPITPAAAVEARHEGNV